MWLIIIGGLLALAGFVLKVSSGTKRQIISWGGLALLLCGVLASAGILVSDNITGGNGNGNQQQTVGGWRISVPQTVQGGGRDATTEIFNDGGTDFSLDCVADTPDGTLDASATNLIINRPEKKATFQVTMDDDLDGQLADGAAFSAPDCHSNDFYAQPLAPIDINSDGAADNQLLWMRVASIGKVSYADNSTSQLPQQIFFWTVAEGFYISFMTEDSDQTGVGTFITACPGSVGKQALDPADCAGWRFVGDSTGAGIFVAFSWLFDSDGAWGYNDGFVQDSFNIVLEFGHGSSGAVTVDDTFTYQVSLNVRT
jgi:hypothetical protein